MSDSHADSIRIAKPKSGYQKSKISPIESKVIYGDDNRLDLYEVTDKSVLALADATVSLVQASNLNWGPNNSVELKVEKFGEAFSLCPEERFFDQYLAPFCSGFLVEPDVIVSAGHCVASDAQCSQTAFIFGYSIESKDVFSPVRPTSEVYRCKKLIHSEVNRRGSDFSVIQLDRDVVGHTPLKIRSEGKLETNESVLVIGHPSGLPTKVAAGAKVRSIENGFFVANLDTYGGNSGSAVFNEATQIVEGVLVRGEQDFTYKNTCMVSNRCEDSGCMGEESTLIENIRPYLQNRSKTRVAP